MGAGYKMQASNTAFSILGRATNTQDFLLAPA
jgi:hypothetical protein